MTYRFNPFRLADNLIETNYRIPVKPPGLIGVSSDESFMTAAPDNTVNLGEYLEFMRSYIYSLQEEIKLYSEYHKAAHKIRNTKPEFIYKEGCVDTFGAGFSITRDHYEDFRNIYWKIQKLKRQND